MYSSPVSVFTEEEWLELYGSGQDHTKAAGIALADGRQVPVSGMYARDSIRGGGGKAGVNTWASSFTFPTHWCEDVAEGDRVQIDDVAHEVKEVSTTTAGLSILKLRRVT